MCYYYIVMEKLKYIVDLDGFLVNSKISLLRELLIDDIYYHKHRDRRVSGVMTVNDCSGVNFDIKFEAKQLNHRLSQITLPYSINQLKRKYYNNLNRFLEK